MKLRPIVLALFALCQTASSPSSAPAGGSVRGRLRVIDNNKDVARENVYVYLQPTRRTRRAVSITPGTLAIKQLKEQFTPQVAVVPTGTTVAFPNYDHEEHNVFSPSDPPFDLGRYNTDHKGQSKKFEYATEIDVFCDIHKDMWAKVKIVDTPYIAAIGANGQFQFDHVPAGTYKVYGWLPNNRTLAEESVVVTDGSTTTLPEDVRLMLDVLPSRPHMRKDGTQYPIYKP